MMHHERTNSTDSYSLQLRTITLKPYVSTRQHVDTITVSLRLEADSGNLIVDASRPTLMARKAWKSWHQNFTATLHAQGSPLRFACV